MQGPDLKATVVKVDSLQLLQLELWGVFTVRGEGPYGARWHTAKVNGVLATSFTQCFTISQHTD